MAKMLKDLVTPVGMEAGDGQSKKGDILIEINSNLTSGRPARIIVEVKMEKNKAVKGKTGILQELEESMNNRGAGYAIAVFSEDSCPREVGFLRAYPGNCLVCKIPADGSNQFILEAAYQIARADLLTQIKNDKQIAPKGQFKDSLLKIDGKLSAFTGLKSKLTQIGSLSTALQSDLISLENDLRAEVNQLISQIQSSIE